MLGDKLDFTNYNKMFYEGVVQLLNNHFGSKWRKLNLERKLVEEQLVDEDETEMLNEQMRMVLHNLHDTQHIEKTIKKVLNNKTLNEFMEDYLPSDDEDNLSDSSKKISKKKRYDEEIENDNLNSVFNYEDYLDAIFEDFDMIEINMSKRFKNAIGPDPKYALNSVDQYIYHRIGQLIFDYIKKRLNEKEKIDNLLLYGILDEENVNLELMLRKFIPCLDFSIKKNKTITQEVVEDTREIKLDKYYKRMMYDRT
ncbi:Hypothetical protein SRAE_0000064400 [Strongyloides ratti]|uniref:Uncharacterized protein n=1 Tax=Strongyloides ratti TaxID=34506 RepID=A0A090L061_STRRB|nr:Hypothetical protein SRAE_0000064400 [Strongyloides ratti]CEF61522.1 Hypothetical protein SRAE_0000064400 [Strongyloides ratti]